MAGRKQRYLPNKYIIFSLADILYTTVKIVSEWKNIKNAIVNFFRREGG
jgi:hypothetical protein